MPAPDTPLRLPERLTAARRLAVGFPVEAVARAARRTVEVIDELTREPGFMQLVASWDELFSLSAAARTKRLMRLAHAALEAALTGGAPAAASTALALLELERRKTDPVVHLANGLARIVERELRRVQKARAAPGGTAASAAAAATGPAAPAEGTAASPASSPPAAGSTAAADRFARRVDAVASRLRGKIVAEHGWTAPPLARDFCSVATPAPEPTPAAAPQPAPLTAADAPATAPPAAPPPADAPAIDAGEAAASEKNEAAAAENDAPAIQAGDAAALEKMIGAELAGLEPEKQAVLARFSADDWARLFLQLMQPPGEAPGAGGAGAGGDDPPGGGWPGGP